MDKASLLLIPAVALLSAAGCSRGPSASNTPAEQLRPIWTNYQLNSTVFAMAFEGSIIWVGTDRGIIKYDLARDAVLAKYDSHSGPSHGPISDLITCIKIDAHGNKWIGTHGGGLSKFDGERWVHYATPDLADPYVYDIAFDPKDRMWVANWRGVSILDQGSWKSYTTEDGVADDWVYALTLDFDGAMWLGTEGGVTRVKERSFVTYSHKDGLGADIPPGTYESFENPSLHHQQTPGKQANSYNPNYVLAAAVDKDNVKWFGTWGAGIARFDGKRWTNFTHREGLAGNFVSDIVVDREGALWVATDGGAGLFRKGSWQKFTTADGLIDNSVFSVAVDGVGNKWFGTQSGISKLEALVPVSDRNARVSRVARIVLADMS